MRGLDTAVKEEAVAIVSEKTEEFFRVGGMHVQLPQEIKFLLLSSFAQQLSKFLLTLFVLGFGRVERVCRLASSLPAVPGILSTTMSCIQGGIAVGFSVLVVHFGQYCFLTGRQHSFAQSLQVFVQALWVFPASIHVRRQQGGEFGFEELGISSSDLFL